MAFTGGYAPILVVIWSCIGQAGLEYKRADILHLYLLVELEELHEVLVKKVENHGEIRQSSVLDSTKRSALFCRLVIDNRPHTSDFAIVAITSDTDLSELPFSF
jgi:hypothetical protein